MPIPNLHLCFQNLEQQRRERIMCKLRDAVLARVAAAGPSKPINAAVESRLQELISSTYTPTHPPYASMIQRAIEELDEEGGGVREGAISKFIKREYEDLPWAHEGLLRHHLKKQCEIGVLVLDGGRYSFNLVNGGDEGGSVDVETESARKRRPGKGRRGRGKWRGREEDEQIIEEFEVEERGGGGEGQNEEMGQSENPNIDEVEKELLACIKLHNQVEANKDEMVKEHNQGGVAEDEVTEGNNQREEQQSGEEQPQCQHDQQEQKSQQEGRVKRGLGRRKANKVRDGGMELVPCAPEQRPLRRRGRSKAKDDTNLGTNAEVVPSLPCDVEPLNEELPRRRRGRSKAKHDMEASTSSQVPCVLGLPKPKRRGPGRPPKPKPDSEATLTILSSSDIKHHSKQQQPRSQAITMRFLKPK